MSRLCSIGSYESSPRQLDPPIGRFITETAGAARSFENCGTVASTWPTAANLPRTTSPTQVRSEPVGHVRWWASLVSAEMVGAACRRPADQPWALSRQILAAGHHRQRAGWNWTAAAAQRAERHDSVAPSGPRQQRCSLNCATSSSAAAAAAAAADADADADADDAAVIITCTCVVADDVPSSQGLSRMAHTAKKDIILITPPAASEGAGSDGAGSAPKDAVPKTCQMFVLRSL